jgi:hypothetical protein
MSEVRNPVVRKNYTTYSYSKKSGPLPLACDYKIEGFKFPNSSIDFWAQQVREFQEVGWNAVTSTVRDVIATFVLATSGAGETWGIIMNSILTLRSASLMIYEEYQYEYLEDGKLLSLPMQLVKFQQLQNSSPKNCTTKYINIFSSL